MANLTITVPDDLLQEARVRAVREGTSVNAILREHLQQYVGQEERNRKLAEAFRKSAAEIIALQRAEGAARKNAGSVPSEAARGGRSIRQIVNDERMEELERRRAKHRSTNP